MRDGVLFRASGFFNLKAGIYHGLYLSGYRSGLCPNSSFIDNRRIQLLPMMRLFFGSGRDLSFPDGRSTFAIKYLKWRYRVHFGPSVKSDGAEKVTVVLLSYKRPQNIEPLVRSALKCGFVDKVIVCNNNPELRMENWLRVSDSRLTVLNQRENTGPRYRFDLAGQEPADYFCFIDDDVFLYPEQIKTLFSRLLENPQVPHGVRGQIVFDHQDFVDGIYGRQCRVDILNGVYAFTKAHLAEYFRLDKELNGLSMVDDIVLSFSGDSAPWCHDIGEILLCPTEALPGVAVWREADFLKYRLAALKRLSEVKRLARSALSLPSLTALPVVANEPLFSIDTIGDDIKPEKQPIVISHDQRSIVIRGWAVDSRARDVAGGVYIDIDGKLYPAYYGGIRKDVAEYFDFEAYLHSGFERPVFDLKPGVHKLSIIVLTNDRKAYYKSRQSITFEVRLPGPLRKLTPPVATRKAAANDDRRLRIRLIRNFYPHWAAHSGAHQFTKHVNGQHACFDQQVVPLGYDRFPLVTNRLRESLRLRVKKNGVQWYDLNHLRAELETVFECFGKGPDIIHCLDGEYVQYLPQLLKKMGRVGRFPPVVASFHQPPAVLRKILNKAVVSLLDHVIIYSSAQANYFDQFVDCSKISFVPHGIDTVYFRPAVRNPDGRLNCLTVGFWLRDFDTMWKVIGKMHSDPDIEFHLVSPRQDPPGHLSNVKVYQNLDDQALLNLYQRCDLLFMPLLDSAANNAILEAAACGLPILTNSVGGVPDYTDESFAVLVPPRDADRFAEIILQLRTAPETLRRMGHAARCFAERNFAWPKITEHLFEVYRMVLASRAN